MATAATKREPADTRLVLLIRKSERRRIEKLARAEKVSVAEIVRRSLATYESIESTLRKRHEEELMKATLEMLEVELTSVNESMAATFEKMDALHLELKKLEIA